MPRKQQVRGENPSQGLKIMFSRLLLMGKEAVR